MTREQAVQRLLEELPEFSPFYEESDGRPTEAGDELLIHVVMGDLARFYMERAAHDPELAARYWRVVEELATEGDQAVENAVHVSLIEWSPGATNVSRRHWWMQAHSKGRRRRPSGRTTCCPTAHRGNVTTSASPLLLLSLRVRFGAARAGHSRELRCQVPAAVPRAPEAAAQTSAEATPFV
jgi:hypothetical protein